MTFRFGSALILIGLLALVVFLLGLTVQQPDVRLLLGGASLSALGLLIHRRAARSQTPSGRFRAIRRALGRPFPPPDDEAG
jgi:hypothetical protein